MFILGITGPTGAGKTTALAVIEQMGGCIIDADATYHQLLERCAPLCSALVEAFGAILGEDGRIDRKKLGTIVFQDAEKLEQLNQIAYPYIVDAVKQEIDGAQQQGCPLAAIDAIGLFESGLDGLCHKTMAITAPPEMRIQRIMAREGISEDYARSRVRAQKPDDFFQSHCDVVFLNDNLTIEAFQAQIQGQLNQFLHNQEG